MFARHTRRQLSAYAHGELAPEEAGRVARHLAACPRCLGDFEEIKLGVRLAESLPLRAAPAQVWDGIEAALAGAASNLPVGVDSSALAGHGSNRSRLLKRAGDLFSGRDGGRSIFRQRPLGALQSALVAASLLCVALGAVWFYRGSTRTAWAVASVEGAPRIGSAAIGKSGRLAVGEWLETDANSRAEISVADIGEVEVEPGTRLRLVETRLTGHRMELARGRMNARIWAPPRLFFVETPSAVAADLGCAYTLEVDDAGRSLLHVTSGWVAFETKERESMVPAGAACVTQPGTGPGTPFFEDASAPFLDALARFDFSAGGAQSLDTVLRESRPRDSLTLWHLLSRTVGAERVRVYERLAALAPPPRYVSREGVLRLDRAMLDDWKDALETRWFANERPNAKGAWRRLRTWYKENIECRLK
jgi:hypothetical protein